MANGKARCRGCGRRIPASVAQQYAGMCPPCYRRAGGQAK